MEAGRNTRNVCVCFEVTGSGRGCRAGHLVVRSQKRIPINLGFILAIRRVPHKFCAVGGEVTNLDVLNVGVSRRAYESRERERRARAVDKPLGGIGFTASVDCNHLEVVRRTVGEACHVNFMAHRVHRILEHLVERTGFACAVKDHRRTALVLSNLHNGGIVTDIADFHIHLFRSLGAVFFLHSDCARCDEHSGSINTGFRKVIIFPAHGAWCPSVSFLVVRSHAAEESAGRRIILVICTRHVLPFRIRCTVVRVSVVLIADAEEEGYIPRVHAEHVVQLVDTELFHLGGFPTLNAFLGELYAFEILGHIGIGENFKNIAGLVTVINPLRIDLHIVPEVVIRDRCCSVQGRDCHTFGSRTAEIADIGSQNQGDVFGVLQTGRVVDAVLETGSFVFEEHLVEAV